MLITINCIIVVLIILLIRNMKYEMDDNRRMIGIRLSRSVPSLTFNLDLVTVLVASACSAWNACQTLLVRFLSRWAIADGSIDSATAGGNRCQVFAPSVFFHLTAIFSYFSVISTRVCLSRPSIAPRRYSQPHNTSPLTSLTSLNGRWWPWMACHSLSRVLP